MGEARIGQAKFKPGGPGAKNGHIQRHSNAVNAANQKAPDPDTCNRIAKALGYSEDKGLEMAGHRSPSPENSEWKGEWIYILGRMTDETRADLKEIAEVLLRRQKRGE